MVGPVVGICEALMSIAFKAQAEFHRLKEKNVESFTTIKNNMDAAYVAYKKLSLFILENIIHTLRRLTLTSF